MRIRSIKPEFWRSRSGWESYTRPVYSVAGKSDSPELYLAVRLNGESNRDRSSAMTKTTRRTEASAPGLWAKDGLDPHDRQSFKRFGTAPGGQEFLYRLYANDMSLLYVGITWNPFVRWTAHSKERDWWGDVAHVAIYLCASDRDARDWETWCIRNLGPRHNKHQKKGWKP